MATRLASVLYVYQWTIKDDDDDDPSENIGNHCYEDLLRECSYGNLNLLPSRRFLKETEGAGNTLVSLYLQMWMDGGTHIPFNGPSAYLPPYT